jgi:hypothetical protein
MSKKTSKFFAASDEEQSSEEDKKVQEEEEVKVAMVFNSPHLSCSLRRGRRTALLHVDSAQTTTATLKTRRNALSSPRRTSARKNCRPL